MVDDAAALSHRIYFNAARIGSGRCGLLRPA
jgi:hypothetical protein